MGSVKTRVLIISDTHTAPLGKQGCTDAWGRSPFRTPLPKADLLIHCGDLTMTGEISEYNETLDMLKKIEAPIKVVIAGNHDLSLDRDYIFSHLEKEGRSETEARSLVDEARHMWSAPDGRARQEGVTYLPEGVHTIDLANGSRVTFYASPYTPEFCDWGFPYKRSEDRWNSPMRMLSNATNVAPCPVPSFVSATTPVDIMITHGPPWARLDKTERGDLAGCPHLLRAVMRARPLIHCFGHIHEGWGAERVTWSKDADTVTETACSIADWKKGAWETGIANAANGKQIQELPADLDAAREDRAVFVTISEDCRTALRRGQETLMVNASVMNLSYKPTNAPWVIDVDLPRCPQPRT